MTTYAFKSKQVAQRLVRIADNYRANYGAEPVNPSKGNGWMLKTPAGGIAEMTGSTPGKADCTPYIIDSNDDLVEAKDSSGNSFTVEVFNPFTVAVEGDTWITAKLVNNHAIVDAEDCTETEPPLSWGGTL